MHRFEYDDVAVGVQSEILRVAKIARKKTPMACCYVAQWTEFMYEVWR